ncbi:exopolysaccharide transport family protein [Hyphomicrobium sp. 99]|uniref:exopolysaccharide transport family protein n=1 Tax=Hyphomicrobium sp. 99 TaxID=1163419 RepID=UPI0018CCD0B6|nr:exopolysaccharide transport family protein [Hyphomicrobium sp. 99]
MFLDKPHAEAVRERAASSPAPSDFDVAAVLATLWRRRFFLLICGVLGAGLAVTAAKFVPHRYVATAELLVDPRDLRLLDKEVMPRAGESDSGITVVESQVQVLSSNSVLKRAIAKLGLQNDPEFNGTASNALSAAISRLTGQSSSAQTGDLELAALQTLQQRIGVKRPERTFVIELSVSSNDPNKSVRIGDAIIAAYLEDQAQYRSSSNEGAAEALDSGLKAMQDQVNAAEEKIASYKAAHNLGLASGKLVVEQQLSDANNQLALARANTDRIKAQIDDIERSRATPESMPEIMASQTLINLKKQLATVSAERARFGAQLMPKHPVMVTMAQQERAVRSEMDREIARVLQSIRHDYERAKANEQSLLDSVARLNGQMNEAAKAQIELRELERNFEVTQTLYQQSVARSRETREQSRLNTTNVRIISSAMPLSARVFPPRGVILAALGFLIGVALGAVTAVLPLVRGLIGSHVPVDAPAPRSASARTGGQPQREKVEGTAGEASAAISPTFSSEHLRRTVEAPSKNSTNANVSEGNSVTSETVHPNALVSSVEIVQAAHLSGRKTAVDTAGPLAQADAEVSEESEVIPLASRRLVSDMRAASRAAQSIWLREGTSAMGLLARSAAKSSDTAFADHIRSLQAYVNGGGNGGISGRIVWFVANHSVPIKPVIALAYAHTIAAEGKKVLIVDGDVRTPGLTRLLVADGELTARDAQEARGRINKTREPNLDVLIVSDPQASSLLAALEAAKEIYEIIVVDTRVEALSADLGAANSVLFVSSNRPNESVSDFGVDALTKDIPRLCGTILTAKGLTSSHAAIAAHAV